MLLGWRDVVEGVFEIRERDGEAIIAVNLIDELTYRVYSNAGPVALAPMEPGCFMIAGNVPIGVGWMLGRPDKCRSLPPVTLTDRTRVARRCRDAGHAKGAAG